MKNNYNIYFLLKKNLLECEKRLEILEEIMENSQDKLEDKELIFKVENDVLYFQKNFQRLAALKKKFISSLFLISDQSALELEFFGYIKKEYKSMLRYCNKFLVNNIQKYHKIKKLHHTVKAFIDKIQSLNDLINYFFSEKILENSDIEKKLGKIILQLQTTTNTFCIKKLSKKYINILLKLKKNIDSTKKDFIIMISQLSDEKENILNDLKCYEYENDKTIKRKYRDSINKINQYANKLYKILEDYHLDMINQELIIFNYIKIEYGKGIDKFDKEMNLKNETIDKTKEDLAKLIENTNYIHQDYALKTAENKIFIDNLDISITSNSDKNYINSDENERSSQHHAIIMDKEKILTKKNYISTKNTSIFKTHKHMCIVIFMTVILITCLFFRIIYLIKSLLR
ncbi:hypothetical protein TCON_2707 [Astathelohania contejeani]|uniref:Uncharacterized protein n=1 Tax=Astathelohania contejeani TaxID=164912 RepID=A0ABQ7HVA6_9MICR|nr:hypothetical protein TCON_2707 [Thelohania contejeani]